MIAALTVAQLKEYVGKKTNIADVYFTSACLAATSRAQKYINQNLVAGANQAVEFVGNGADFFIVPANINIAIISLQYRALTSVLSSDWVMIPTTSYQLTETPGGNWIVRMPTFFDNSTRYLLTFTSGYALQAEVQTLILGGWNWTFTGGTFILSFGGYSTTALAWNASAATIQTALQVLTSIGTGNVLVTGSLPTGLIMTFAGTLAPGVQPLTGFDGSLLTPSMGQDKPAGAITETTAGVSTPDDIRLGLSILGALQIYNSNIDGGQKMLILQTMTRNEASGATTTDTVMAFEDLEMKWQVLLNPYLLASV